jgi:formylglycine-generating enzyme required for sulfatase activity
MTFTPNDTANYNSANQNVAVTVRSAMPITITTNTSGCLTPVDRVYDGTTNVTFTGTSMLTGIASGDNVTLNIGSSAFADANAGSNKPIVFTNWTLGGADAGKYVLQMPALTANITKANPVVTWPTGLTASNGQKFSDITLPGNGASTPAGTFAWTNPNDLIGSAGTQSQNMTFTPNDATNYNSLTQSVSVTVNAATILNYMKMRNVPSGYFDMGCPASESERFLTETPVHMVMLTKGFYIGEYPVTQELYEAVTGKNPSFFKVAYVGEDKKKLPVETVSWFEALIFCNKLSVMEGLSPAYKINGSTDPDSWGKVPESFVQAWFKIQIVSDSTGYRLPTEAEWEYACRAGTSTPRYSTESLKDIAWYKENSSNRTHEVGLKTPNAWGLYDMLGNVNEMCWDACYSGIYNGYPNKTLSDPWVMKYVGDAYMARGGAWKSQTAWIRSGFRNQIDIFVRADDVGFRVIRPE